MHLRVGIFHHGVNETRPRSRDPWGPLRYWVKRKGHSVLYRLYKPSLKSKNQELLTDRSPASDFRLVRGEPGGEDGLGRKRGRHLGLYVKDWSRRIRCSGRRVPESPDRPIRGLRNHISH